MEFRLFRLQEGLKLKDVSAKTGISTSHLCLMENGQRECSYKACMKLKNAYGKYFEFPKMFEGAEFIIENQFIKADLIFIREKIDEIIKGL